MYGTKGKIEQDISLSETIVHDRRRIRLVDTFQIGKFPNLITNGSHEGCRNLVKGIPIQKNLQAVYLQSKGMANHDK